MKLFQKKVDLIFELCEVLNLFFIEGEPFLGSPFYFAHSPFLRLDVSPNRKFKPLFLEMHPKFRKPVFLKKEIIFK